MLEFWHTIVFSLSVTGPIFILLALGIWLRRRQILNDAFIEVGSRLVFTLSLPALLFVSIAKTPVSTAANLNLIGYAVMAMTLIYILSEWVAQALVNPPEDRGVVVQGAFRSNMGIIGLAYCINAYGPKALAASSL